MANPTQTVVTLIAVVSLLAGCDDVLVEPLDPVHPSLADLGPLSDLQDEKLAIEINAVIADGALPSGALSP